VVTLVGGVDDSGRGCLLGPLVIAGVSVDKSSLEDLRELGVRDSKKLTPRQRESLYPEILKVSDRVSSRQIPPSEIDEVVRTGKKYRKLNYLEALYFARVVDELGADPVVVDASDSSPERFRRVILENLKRICTVTAAHKADRDFPVVSAASIVAKVERDRVVERLRKKMGDFGSGYPSDPKTRIFFIERMRRGEAPPEQARLSWKTWKRLQQSVLAHY